jgi:hypothetical protein
LGTHIAVVLVAICRNLKVQCVGYCRTDFEKFEADETLVVIVVLL